MIRKYPESEKFIRKIYGSEEYINGKELYCLWIDDDDIEMAESIPPIKQRIEANRNFRLNESADGQALAEKAHQFREHPDDMEKIIIPSVSSENRNYIPIGFLDNKTIVSNAAFADNRLGVLFGGLHLNSVSDVSYAVLVSFSSARRSARWTALASTPNSRLCILMQCPSLVPSLKALKESFSMKDNAEG